jgi:ubiquinone biosynthesis protein
LIEDWIVQNLGPQAQLRSVMEDGLEAARRLPHLVDRVERTLESVADGGLKLHPTSLAALLGRRRKGSGLAWTLCLILAGVVVGLLLG